MRFTCFDVARSVLGEPESIKRAEHYWTCPNHEDKHPSLTINGRKDCWMCGPCGAKGTPWQLAAFISGNDPSNIEGVTDWLKQHNVLFGNSGQPSSRRKEGSTPPETSATLQPHSSKGGCTLDKYAEKKKLPEVFLKELGLHTQNYQRQKAIRIPYFGQDGQELAVRYRLALDKSENGDNRFRWKTGNKVRLYGLWLLDQARKSGYAIAVEGESDCHTLWFHKVPAFGIPGAGIWREEWVEDLEGIPTIYFVVEPDQGGQSVLKWLARSEIRHRARLVFSLGAKDPSQLYLSNPDGFREALQQALDSAIPWEKWVAEQVNSKTEEAWEQCQELAEEPQMLERFSRDLERCGVAGEKRAGQLLFLILNTRFLPRLVSAAMKGPSAGGKNYLLEHILEFFPPDAYYALTAMSERALAYSEEPLSHRFLVIFEAVGLENDFTSYLVRSLLSEQRVRYETVEKTKDGLKTRLIEKEGPTGLLVTTTAVSLHQENETRFFSIPITDTADQTRDILLTQADAINNPHSDIDFSMWHALQQWLQGAEHRVYIPYAQALAQSIPPIAVRLRRDFTAILRLIYAHAILHQVHRGRDDEGKIIATLDDYSVVRELLVDLVEEALEAKVSDTVRETVEAVRDLGSPKTSVTNAQVAKKLDLDKSAAYRRVQTAIQKGYIENLEDKKGRPARLVIGDPLPDEVVVLPLPKTLASQTGCNDSATTYVQENKDISSDGCRVADVSGGVSTLSYGDEPPEVPVEVF